MRLNSRAFLDTPSNEPPRLELAWLEGETDGIIALTGGPGGPLDSAIAAGQSHLAAARLDTLIKLFGDRLYVELQRHGTPAERRSEPMLIDLAYAKRVPLVATNEPYFAAAQDYEAQDALICIAEGRLLLGKRPAATDSRTPLQEAARRWSNCLPTCPRRLLRRSRSRNAVPSAAHAPADFAALLGRRKRQRARRGERAA